MNKMIFSKYISALGTGDLKNVDYKKLDIYAVIQPLNYLFDTPEDYDKPEPFVPKDTDVLNVLLKKNSKNTEYVNIRKFKDYRLLRVNEKTFNKDTLDDSEHTYQELRDENVQEYVFGNDDDKSEYSKYSPIKLSLDYKDAANVYNYDHKYIKTEPTDIARTRYNALINDYSIETNGYRKSDFTRLSVKEDQIIESEIVLTADDFAYTEYNTKDKILNHGIYGFYLTLPGKYKNNIPIVLYLFDQPTYSNYNKIKLVFNADGLFGVV